MTGKSDKPLRVLFLIDSLATGGAERITVALLPHFDRTQIIPIVCPLTRRWEGFLGDLVPPDQRDGIKSKRLLDPFAFRRLLRLIREQEIDIIHAQLQYATFFGAAATRFTGVPMVVTRHLIGDFSYNLRSRLRNRLEHMTIRRYAARVITVSNAAQENYAKLAGISPERMITIYNGIDVEKFTVTGDKRSMREALNLPVDKTLVTLVGVMREGKGHTVAIDAMRQLEDTDVRLLFAGDGWKRDDFEQYARDLGDRVIFLGERKDVPDILAASDIVILPSDTEALPTVLIEAGAAGLPTIATDVGGCPEVVLDDETGIIIPLQNPDALARAIRRLLNHPETAQKMGKAAYERVHALFTLPVQAAALSTVYQEIVREDTRQKSM